MTGETGGHRVWLSVERDVAALLERKGLSLTTAVPSGNPSKEILRAAAELEADLVVVGSKGQSG